MTPHTRTIPSSGEQLPIIGLGTWRAFDVGPAPSALAPLRACVTAFDALGGRVIDSSPMYGRAEQVVGDLTSAPGLRPRLFIATKVWTSGKQRGIDQMRESMRKLRVSQVDLMQVHNLVDVSTHLETLREWNQQHHTNGQPRVGLWLPMNIRRESYAGFGNGTSRIRLYARYAPSASLIEKAREVRRQVPGRSAESRGLPAGSQATLPSSHAPGHRAID